MDPVRTYTQKPITLPPIGCSLLVYFNNVFLFCHMSSHINLIFTILPSRPTPFLRQFRVVSYAPFSRLVIVQRTRQCTQTLVIYDYNL